MWRRQRSNPSPRRSLQENCKTEASCQKNDIDNCKTNVRQQCCVANPLANEKAFAFGESVQVLSLGSHESSDPHTYTNFDTVSKSENVLLKSCIPVADDCWALGLSTDFTTLVSLRSLNTDFRQSCCVKILHCTKRSLSSASCITGFLQLCFASTLVSYNRQGLPSDHPSDHADSDQPPCRPPTRPSNRPSVQPTGRPTHRPPDRLLDLPSVRPPADPSPTDRPTA